MGKKCKILLLNPPSDNAIQQLGLLGDMVSANIENVNIVMPDASVRNDISGFVKREAVDLMVTFDLYGFERSTLAGGLSYNLLPCKQIHIITEKNLPNEKYLENPLSIAMFFYCTEESLYHYLLGKYPDLPYLETLKGWKNENGTDCVRQNAEALCKVIEEVIDICHL